MKTKQRVKKWITNHKSLRDNDNALCVYIWAEEMEELGLGNINVPTICMIFKPQNDLKQKLSFWGAFCPLFFI